MRLPTRLLGALPLSTAMLLASAGLSGCAHREATESAVVQQDVPADAWRVISTRTRGGTITELTRINEDGQTRYQAEWRQGNKDHELEVAPDGTLVSVETELTRPELPPAVGRAADMLTRTREAKIVRYFREEEYLLSRLEATKYEVKVLTSRGETEYEIGLDGKVLGSETSARESHEGDPKADTASPTDPADPVTPAAPAANAGYPARD